ncbi:anti-sigma factor [soil metagenome]
MSPEEREELAALYALDLLDGDELTNFRKAVGADPKLAAMVDEFRAASNLLGESVPQYNAPTYLRERIVDAYVAQKSPPKPVAEKKDSVFSWVPWAIAAALAILCVLTFKQKSELGHRLDKQVIDNTGLQVQVAGLTAERERLEAKVTTLQAERDRFQTRLAALDKRDPFTDIQTIALTPQPNTPATGVALAIWNAKTQSGVLNAAQLPPPGPDKDYQLWIVPPGASPLSAGTLGETPGISMPFKSPVPVPQVAALAISLEPKGGSISPTGPIVYVGKL